MLHTTRQKKTEAENLLNDTIRQLGNINKNSLKVPKIVSTKFNITAVINKGPPLMEEDPSRGNQSADQTKLQSHRNQKKSASKCSSTMQAADPTLVQILMQMEQLMQRPQRQQTSADKCIMIPQQYFDGSNPGTA